MSPKVTWVYTVNTSVHVSMHCVCVLATVCFKGWFWDLNAGAFGPKYQLHSQTKDLCICVCVMSDKTAFYHLLFLS